MYRHPTLVVKHKALLFLSEGQNLSDRKAKEKLRFGDKNLRIFTPFRENRNESNYRLSAVARNNPGWANMHPFP